MEEKIQEQSVTTDLAALGELLEDEIRKRDCSEEEKAEMLEKLRQFREAKTNIVLVGATGSGKSSTINALFSCGEPTADTVRLQEVAKVGITPDPETSEIEKYTIGNLTLRASRSLTLSWWSWTPPARTWAPPTMYSTTSSSPQWRTQNESWLP